MVLSQLFHYTPRSLKNGQHDRLLVLRHIPSMPMALRKAILTYCRVQDSTRHNPQLAEVFTEELLSVDYGALDGKTLLGRR